MSRFVQSSITTRRRPLTNCQGRFEPSSRTLLIGEQPNPWGLLQSQDRAHINHILLCVQTISSSFNKGCWHIIAVKELLSTKSDLVSRYGVRETLYNKLSKKYGFTKSQNFFDDFSGIYML